MTDFYRKISLTEMNRDLSFVPNRHLSMSKSMKKRLSVTTLLEYAELQAENISNVFQKIDTEKYLANYNKSKTLTDSMGSLDDEGAYDLLPSDEVKFTSDSDVSSCVWFGVTTEYMTRSKRLKVSIERHGSFLNKVGKKGTDHFFAKVFLIPGKSKKQKVDVTSSLDVNLAEKPAVFFQGYSGPKLAQMELGVKILLKRGMFRKHVVIHEWSISMEDINLLEPQTAWKKIEWFP